MFRLSLPVIGLLILLAVPGVVAAGAPVDPSSLFAEPPPGAQCHAAGNQVICDTQVDESILAPTAVADLPCGTLYETNSDVRQGTRWYDSDGLLVERHVTQQLRGTWSLSPDMSEPVVLVTVHATWRDRLAVPGDFESNNGTLTGASFTIMAPGHGTIVHTLGREGPNGFSGRFDDFDDAVIAEIRDALTD
jgi:hypothetical protein